jgi:hypothetical protein
MVQCPNLSGVSVKTADAQQVHVQTALGSAKAAMGAGACFRFNGSQAVACGASIICHMGLKSEAEGRRFVRNRSSGNGAEAKQQADAPAAPEAPAGKPCPAPPKHQHTTESQEQSVKRLYSEAMVKRVRMQAWVEEEHKKEQPATREHTTESQEQAVHRLYKQPLDRKMQQELELKQKLEAPDPSKRKLNPQEQERIVEHMYKRALAHIHGRK